MNAKAALVHEVTPTSQPNPSAAAYPGHQLASRRAAPRSRPSRSMIATSADRPGRKHSAPLRPSAVPVRDAPILQRCGGHACPPSGCHQGGEEGLQRSPGGHGSSSSAQTGALPIAPPIVHRVLDSPGQPLEGGLRRMMESGLGHNFGRVRIHSGPEAAQSAHSVGADAYTVGPDIVLGGGVPVHGTAMRRLLAHELMHVIHQSGTDSGTRATGSIPIGPPDDRYEREAARVAEASDRWDAPAAAAGRFPHPAHQGPAMGPRMQRLVRTSSVTCPAAATGIANPHTGSADRRASTLLDRAITRITNAQAARAANPADPDVVAVGGALHTAFRLNPANAGTWTAGPPTVNLPVILRRLQAAKTYIDSVVFTIHCIPNGGAGYTIPGCTNTACAAGTEAFSCHANPVEIVLCPDFWARTVDQRGRVWMHEVMHIDFGFIDDWGHPDVHNAHCYAQFVALLNGFNSPAGFRCH